MNLGSRIIDHIRANPYCSFDQIMEAMEQQHYAAGWPTLIVLNLLVTKHKVLVFGEHRASNLSHTRYAIETIGACEICGLTDHHLIQGACPGCRDKFNLGPVKGYRVNNAQSSKERYGT